jgi:hypothetical protein
LQVAVDDPIVGDSIEGDSIKLAHAAVGGGRVGVAPVVSIKDAFVGFDDSIDDVSIGGDSINGELIKLASVAVGGG